MKIEALFSGAATEGERASAGLARQRILRRLAELIPEDPPVEYKFTFRDMWSHKVFMALLRRYGLKPYRYHAQRYTTVMVQVPKRFVDETLWPEFQKNQLGVERVSPGSHRQGRKTSSSRRRLGCSRG